MNYLAIGLVVKGGKEFIENWIKCAEELGDVIFVIDNGTDEEMRNILINHKKVKRYLIQKDLERNQSRDYQKILEMAREEDVKWVWNLDIDEYVPDAENFNIKPFLLNCEFESVGFPLVEMRNDNKHYIAIPDPTKGMELKDGRLCHKCYKVLSHFKFDEKDKHGQSIPHNCSRVKNYINIPIQHFGHMTKELREEKRKVYDKGVGDKGEILAPWFEEDESKLTIREWEGFYKLFKNV